MLTQVVMPLVYVLLSVCSILFATCGSSSPVAPSGLNAAAPGGRSFKVMTFNIQHGMDGRDEYNLQRAIDVIARVQPDLVGLQEVTRNHSKYRCDDQPALIAEGLRRATGRVWTHAYVQEWFTKDRSCADQGRGDGPETEGLAFLAPEPLGEVTHTRLFNSRIGLAVRTPAGNHTPVIVTHLAHSARNTDDRIKQIAQLLPWSETLGVPRILIGDLNAAADAAEMQPVFRMYRDAWVDAVEAGTARGVTSGATRVSGTGRIDYVLYVGSQGISVEWAETVDTAALIGIDASDHRPVVVSFKLR